MKEKYKLGWKVVSKTLFDQLQSATAYSVSSATNFPSVRVLYSKLIWSEPQKGKGPLCLFKTRKQARRFRNEMVVKGITVIYRCKYIPSQEKSIWNGAINHNLGVLPTGTILADKVKLLYRA